MKTHPIGGLWSEFVIFLFRDLRPVSYIHKELNRFGIEISRRALDRIIKAEIPAAERAEIKSKRALSPRDVWRIAILYFFYRHECPPRLARNMVQSLLEEKISMQAVWKQWRLFEKGFFQELTRAQASYIARALAGREDFARLLSSDPTYTTHLAQMIVDADRRMMPWLENTKHARKSLTTKEIFDSLP